MVLEKKIIYISSMYFCNFVITSLWKKGRALHLNKLESPSSKDALCQAFGSGELKTSRPELCANEVICKEFERKKPISPSLRSQSSFLGIIVIHLSVKFWGNILVHSLEIEYTEDFALVKAKQRVTDNHGAACNTIIVWFFTVFFYHFDSNFSFIYW